MEFGPDETAPVFPIKPPKGFKALTTACVERRTRMIVYERGLPNSAARKITPRSRLEGRVGLNRPASSALSKTFREGEVNRAEGRRDCVPRHGPSSSGPDIGQVSDPPARVSAPTTPGARHSAETTLVPTSARLTTPFKIRGTLVSLRSMATGRCPAI